jgi:ribosomal protein S18 acetylase RimI-like enzyme
VNRPDWVQWHNLYETPEHVVAQRLLIVQRLIRDFLASRSGDEIRIVSICSGQGRDILGAPVYASVTEASPVTISIPPRPAACACLVDVEVYEDRTAGLAFVIAPDRRGSGLGRRALHAIAAQLAADGIREVFGGAEANNAASIRCLEGAGFSRRSDEPDAEGFLYLERHLTNATMV